MNKGYILLFSLAAIVAISVSVLFLTLEEKQPQIIREDFGTVDNLGDIWSNEDLSLQEKNQLIAENLIDDVINKFELGNKQITSIENDLTLESKEMGIRYVFVISQETDLIVAHPNEQRIGKAAFILDNSIETKETIKNQLNEDGEIWIHYMFENPETGNIEPKKSLLKAYDGLIFGSGFYN